MSGRLVVHCVLLLLALGTKDGGAMPLKDTLFVVHPVGPPQEGHTVTLTCYIDGPSAPLVPRPSSYVWVKDGKVIPGQSGVKLTLSHLKKQDEGDYQCGDPDSDLPRGKHQLRLSDRDSLPVQDQFVVHAEGTHREGHTVNLTCYIDGPSAAFVPLPSSYVWVKDGKVIPGQSGVTLTLRHVTRQDEGDFQCGDPDSSLPRGKYQLNLLNGDPGPLRETTFYVDEVGSPLQGQTLTLKCYLFGPLGQNPSSYVWRKDGHVLPHETKKEVILHSLTSEDSGDYQCGDPDSDIPRRTHHVNVFSNLPTPTVFADKFGVCGRTSSLNCVIMKYYKMNARMTYAWFKDFKEIKGQTGPVLWLHNVTEEDTGAYTCTVREGPVETTSPHSQAYNLVPLVVPELRILPSNTDSVVKGILREPLTLTCKVVRAFPGVPSDGYIWSFLPAQEGPPQYLMEKAKALTVGPLTRQHSGLYHCQARNDRDLDSVTLIGEASVTVDVVYLENLFLTPALEVNEGDNLTLTCGVDSHPEAHLAWIVKGQEVRHVIDRLDHYVIKSAACSDSGNYTCLASNADMPGRQIKLTTQVRVHCKKDLEPQRLQTFFIYAGDPAYFHVRLPKQTSMLVVHPSGQDLIRFYPNCSYVVFEVFRPRCQDPHCDHGLHFISFTLTQMTEGDKGDYICFENGQQTPSSLWRVTVKRQVTETNKPGIVGSVTTAVILVVILGVLVIVIFMHRRKISVLSIQLGGTSTVSPVPGSSPIRFQMNGGNLCFDKLYENSKVYVFPTLVTPEEKPEANNEENSESTHLLRQNPEEVAVYTVKNLVRHTLQTLPRTNDLPSFILHNTHLSKEEKVVLILSRGLGLIMMIVKVVKATKDGIQMKPLERAVEHLMASRKLVEKHLNGFIKSGMIKTALALPNLSETDWNRFGKKFKDVEVLLGKEKEDAEQWIEQLTKESNSDVWDLNTPEATSPDITFKMAASEFLTLAASYHPDESPKHPTATESCLLTPVQMEVRDSTAKLLHIWGPPGSGKTTLLIHRARQWLAEGKAVVLAVGRDVFDVLLAFVIKGVLREQNEETLKRIRICRTHKILPSTVAELQSVYPKIEICLIIDTLREVELLQNMLRLVKSKRVSAAWTVCRDKLEVINKELSSECHEEGWETFKLPESIRCTPDTVELLNQLGQGSNHHYAITACSVPRYQEIPKRRIVPHFLHQSTKSSCNSCKSELTKALPPSKQGQHWEDWIAICTGNPHDLSDLQPLCATLRDFGLPASLDRHYDIVASHGSRLDSSDADVSKWLERVVAGNDERGNPTLHLVRVNDVGGVEKEGVLVVHHDKRDTDPDCQSEGDKETRLNEHRRHWIWAVSRCKGQVILLLLTPSPACGLLNLGGKT